MREDENAILPTVYPGDQMTNVHHKSPTNRKLFLKTHVLITTLAALIYLVACLVRLAPSLLALSTPQTIGDSSNPWFRIGTEGDMSNDERSLTHLLENLTDLNASDPRGKVYAVLGMSNEQDKEGV
jgi:hypothetical protein